MCLGKFIYIITYYRGSNFRVINTSLNYGVIIFQAALNLNWITKKRRISSQWILKNRTNFRQVFETAVFRRILSKFYKVRRKSRKSLKTVSSLSSDDKLAEQFKKENSKYIFRNNSNYFEEKIYMYFFFFSSPYSLNFRRVPILHFIKFPLIHIIFLFYRIFLKCIHMYYTSIVYKMYFF